MVDFLTEQLQEQVRQTKQKQAEEPKVKTVEREWQSDEGRNQKLVEVAERLTPEGSKWVSSFAVHIYHSTAPGSQDAMMLAQVTNTSQLPEALAHEAVKELVLHVMRKYGRKPPAKRGTDYGFKNDSSLVMPE